MTPEPAASRSRRNLTSGSAFERQYNYSRAVVIGDQVFISGTTGYDYRTSELPATAEAQAAQLFRNVEAVLAQAGGTLQDVVRVRIYVADPDAYEPIMQAYAGAFEGVSPACTTVEAKLFDPAILVEMDMDAVLNARA